MRYHLMAFEVGRAPFSGELARAEAALSRRARQPRPGGELSHVPTDLSWPVCRTMLVGARVRVSGHHAHGV